MLRRYEDSVDSAKHPTDLPWRQGKLLQSMARYEDALVQYHAMQQQGGSTPQLLRQMASCHQALGQWQSAEQANLLASQLESTPLQTASLTTVVAGERQPTFLTGHRRRAWPRPCAHFDPPLPVAMLHVLARKALAAHRNDTCEKCALAVPWFGNRAPRGDQNTSNTK